MLSEFSVNTFWHNGRTKLFRQTKRRGRQTYPFYVPLAVLAFSAFSAICFVFWALIKSIFPWVLLPFLFYISFICLLFKEQKTFLWGSWRRITGDESKNEKRFFMSNKNKHNYLKYGAGKRVATKIQKVLVAKGRLMSSRKREEVGIDDGRHRWRMMVVGFFFFGKNQLFWRKKLILIFETFVGNIKINEIMKVINLKVKATEGKNERTKESSRLKAKGQTKVCSLNLMVVGKMVDGMREVREN